MKRRSHWMADRSRLHPAVCLTALALALNYASRAILPVGAGALASIFADPSLEAVTLVSMSATSFYAGDLAAQLFSGSCLRRVSGTRLLVISCAGIGACSLATPFALRAPNTLLVYLQVAYGAFCGLGYPSAHALVGETASHEQRSTSLSIINAAASVGMVLGNSSTPVLIAHLAWPAPFVLAAIGCLAMVGAMSYLSSSMPSSTARSRAKEAANGQLAAAPQPQSATQELITWMHDPFLQAMMLGYYVQGVAYHGINSFLPTILSEVYQTEPAKLGGLTAIPPVVQVIACFVGGLIADRLIASERYPLHRVRTGIQTLATIGPALGIFGLRFASSETIATVAATFWLATGSLHSAGLTATFHDVAQARAGELFAVANVACKFAAALAPMWIKFVALRWGWSMVLYLGAAHYIVAGFVLLPRMHHSVKTALLFNDGGAKAKAE